MVTRGWSSPGRVSCSLRIFWSTNSSTLTWSASAAVAEESMTVPTAFAFSDSLSRSPLLDDRLPDTPGNRYHGRRTFAGR